MNDCGTGSQDVFFGLKVIVKRCKRGLTRASCAALLCNGSSNESFTSVSERVRSLCSFRMAVENDFWHQREEEN